MLLFYISKNEVNQNLFMKRHQVSFRIFPYLASLVDVTVVTVKNTVICPAVYLYLQVIMSYCLHPVCLCCK